MEMLRLDVSLVQLERVTGVVAQRSEPVAVSCFDANPVMLVAALRGHWGGPVGVWLEICADYPAALAARDVATLSWLVDLDNVVVSSPSHAASHADVVRALLSDDEVNLTNDVTTLRGAFNRPAPPNVIKVWSWDGDALRHGATLLRARSRSLGEAGELTTFA